MGKISTVLFFIGILISSCTKEVNIDVPEHNPSLVINSLFSSGSIINLYVGKSVSIFDNSNKIIPDAKVLLYEESTIIDTLIFHSGLYISKIQAKSNTQYTIEVSAEGFACVSATNTVPNNPVLISISQSDSTVVNDDGIRLSQVILKFKDENPEKDYYEVILYLNYYDSYSKEYVTISTWIDEVADPVILGEGLFNYSPESYIFSDKLFNGGEYTMYLNYYKPDYISSYKLILYFNKTSEDYYLYKRKLTIFKWSQDQNIFSGPSEPVILHSNINGGLGIFAGFSTVSRIININ